MNSEPICSKSSRNIRSATTPRCGNQAVRGVPREIFPLDDLRADGRRERRRSARIGYRETFEPAAATRSFGKNCALSTPSTIPCASNVTKSASVTSSGRLAIRPSGHHDTRISSCLCALMNSRSIRLSPIRPVGAQCRDRPIEQGQMATVQVVINRFYRFRLGSALRWARSPSNRSLSKCRARQASEQNSRGRPLPIQT